MRRTFIALLSILASCTLGATTAYAQTNSLTVLLGGRLNAGPVSGAPGSTVTIPVLVTGMTGTVPSSGVEITVPSPLRVLNTSTCTAETVAVRANATISMHSCKIVGWDGANGSQIISVRIEGLGSYTGFRVNAMLLVEIPANQPVGSTYTLSAPNKYFAEYRSPSEITITVVSSTVTKSPPTMADIPAPTVKAEGSIHDIDGSALEFRMGSIKPFSFEVNYDGVPEATTASLILYTDTGMIEVSDPSVVDLDAAFICEEDEAGTAQSSTKKSKRPITELPTVFNLSLGRWMEPGTEVRVCAEVVYFDGTQILGTERYMSVITVRE